MREFNKANATRFRALHERGGLFVMPNPWDAGTARLLKDFGFEAIATSSAALAWSMARADVSGAVRRDDAIAHARLLSEATGLPVNGDFESGYGDSPAEVAETIKRAIEAGVAGCSIEDQDQGAGGLYRLDEALRRFSAAREAVLKSRGASKRSTLSYPFHNSLVLTLWIQRLIFQ